MSRSVRSTEGFYDDYIVAPAHWVSNQGKKAVHWIEDEFNVVEHEAKRIIDSGVNTISDEIHELPNQIKAVGDFIDSGIDYAIDKLAHAEDKLLPSTQTIISSELLLLMLLGTGFYLYLNSK